MDKKDAKIIFMGTPDIAARCLEQILADGYNVRAVFTREDKPVGRKQIMTPPPVKEVAVKHGIPVHQPKTLKTGADRIIKEINPDLIVVVAYGRILPREIIAMPALGCINLHVSLLPKYRGAAPIQWSLINGDKQTGVTVMKIDRGLDTGDIIDVLPIEIDFEENRRQLFEKVSRQGKVFLSRVMDKILAGDISCTPQDHSKATLAPPLTKDMALFGFEESALVLHNKIRGQNPWPGAYFEHMGKKVKVLKALYTDGSGKPGDVLSAKPLIVAAKDGALRLDTLQPEGGKAMDGTAWARGRRLKAGDNLFALTEN